MSRWAPAATEIPAFSRGFLEADLPFSRLGGGEIGGKARGLVLSHDILQGADPGTGGAGSVESHVPRFLVLGTGVFDKFMERNGLYEAAVSGLPDERIAHAFLQAELPAEILGDLRTVVERLRSPLAVRSSSLLEDALFHPFAGVYETKMTPNNQPEVQDRFRKLSEAVKLIYSSTFFASARAYHQASGSSTREEKMAVLIQEVMGRRHDTRFYPTLSGVGRSWNFYPVGRARPEDGVVNLALGLGKTIVDGGISFSYSPARPKAPPPYGSAREMMRMSQNRFWAVNVGPPPPYNPTSEAEYLVHLELSDADYDGALPFIASTYVAGSDRLAAGTGHEGPRVLDFAPLLKHRQFPLNELVKIILKRCEEALGCAVEIEFAMSFPKAGESAPARFGLLQVRPMLVSEEVVEVASQDLGRPDLLLASSRAMGNGVSESIRDVVYVRPERFQASRTSEIASDIDKLNSSLAAAGRTYLLVGFGRWGSSNPWLGIPVTWGQISAARALVEATLDDYRVEASQGSHLFHNMCSFRVSYFAVRSSDERSIDWSWLQAQPHEAETDLVRHVRLDHPLLIKVDGRTGSGAIWRPAPGESPGGPHGEGS